MIILGNFYRIREKGDESIPEKDSIIKINKYENKVYYYEIVNGIFYFNKRFKEDSQFLKFCDKVDIESIQQYLPEGHPDKIKSSISFKFNINDEVKVKSGGCYISSPENWVKESHELAFPSERYGTFGKIADRKHCQNLNWYKPFNCGNWITEDGLELVKTEIIPEYVEYIDTKYKGQIVKVEEWTSHSFCCIRFENGQREQPFKHLVKSSTKDAYEAQNKPKQLTVDDLIEGEVYFCKNCSFENGNSGYIFLKIGNDSIKHIAIGNKDYSQTGWNFWTAVSSFDLRQATSEEKKWLNICIKWSKFIPEEDLHLYDDSGLLVRTNKKVKNLLEEAKERYPIGTKFKSVVTGTIFTVRSHINNGNNSNILFDTFEFNLGGNNWGCIHEKGTWAEIVSLPNKQECIPKVGDWYILEKFHTSYWFKGKVFQIGSIAGAYIHPMVNGEPYLQASIMINGNFKDCRSALPHEIPITSNCILYNGENISKSFEVSQYYEFDGKSFNQDIYIAPITKKTKKLQTITIESTTDLNLNLTKIKSKQIQTIKI